MRRVIAVGVLILASGCAESEGYLIQNARIGGQEGCRSHSKLTVDAKVIDPLDARGAMYVATLLGGHCLVPAPNRMVLRYIQYKASPPFISDMESYVQISIEADIPEDLSIRAETPLLNVRIYYSEVGTWPERGQGWYGGAADSRLVLASAEPGIQLLAGTISITALHAREGTRATRDLNLSQQFRVTELDRLTHCLGVDPKCPVKPD
jgi:hypothetical protein